MSCSFKFDHFEEIFQKALDAGYEIVTLKQFFEHDYHSDKILVNRIDVDFDPKRVCTMREIFDRLNIKGSFYFRLHSKDYNIFSFENYNIIKELLDSNHEIGLHSEIIDFEKICGQDAGKTLSKEIELFEQQFAFKMAGVASHGDYTGYNNLDFWQNNNAPDFGLLYEAYDKKLWEHSFYISDSLIKGWKSYTNGTLNENDHRCPCQVFNDAHPVIYLLTHPFCFYWRHFHE